MATRVVTLKGTGKWMKVFEQNRDKEGYNGAYQDCDGACVMDLYLTKEEYQKLKDAKSATKLKLDEDSGERFIKLKRKFKDRYEWASGAPKVTKADGTDWDVTTDGLIGNGSEVEVTVSVYDTSMTAGTRLEKVKVLKAEPLPAKALEVEGVPF